MASSQISKFLTKYNKSSLEFPTQTSFNMSVATERGVKYGSLDKELNLFDPETAYKLSMDRWIWKNNSKSPLILEKSFFNYRNFINGYLSTNNKTNFAKTYKIPLYEPIIIDHFLYLNCIYRSRKPNEIYIYYNPYILQNLIQLKYMDVHNLLTSRGIILAENIARAGFNGFNIKCLIENYGLFNEIIWFFDKLKVK